MHRNIFATKNNCCVKISADYKNLEILSIGRNKNTTANDTNLIPKTKNFALKEMVRKGITRREIRKGERGNKMVTIYINMECKLEEIEIFRI